ncbi:hypothetical protein ROZALSC1DRAFT_27556 [Rozella allomycis CSF55]|uniref:Uncharacterized protein n=1 Tax=Rozella allomycis (strain CSF55) TaxID=988480 RepID=A0A4P9YND3_ROZAC|nr:hypothetical protein ROZALSC1DRAFT_27556 [Rozella allomycis CSF55]
MGDDDYLDPESEYEPLEDEELEGRPRKVLPQPTPIQETVKETRLPTLEEIQERSLLEKGEIIMNDDPNGARKLLEKMGYPIPEEVTGPLGFHVFQLASRLNEKNLKMFYANSLEVGRHLGFRDSYTFYLKHDHFVKIPVSEIERNWLIEKRLVAPTSRSRTMSFLRLDLLLNFFTFTPLLAENAVKPPSTVRVGTEVFIEVESDEEAKYLSDDEAMYATRYRKKLAKPPNEDGDQQDKAFADACKKSASYNSHLAMMRSNRSSLSQFNLHTEETLVPFKYVSPFNQWCQPQNDVSAFRVVLYDRPERNYTKPALLKHQNKFH